MNVTDNTFTARDGGVDSAKPPRTCTYPACEGRGERVNVFGRKGEFAMLCRPHAKAWDLIASQVSVKRGRGRVLAVADLRRCWREFIESPETFGLRENGLCESAPKKF